MIFDAQRAVGLNLLGSPKDLGQRALSQSPCLGCFPVAVFFLFIEVIDRHEAAPPLEGIAEGELALNPLGFGVDVIRNPHTRRAYARAADEFLAWCSAAGVPAIGAVQPVHVATWIEAGTRELAAPSVKQRLAAVRHLFDWLVTGQVVAINPAASVRGPRHVVTSGQTPVLDPVEARAHSTASTLRPSSVCAIAP